MFVYWGRHGALPQLTLELAHATARAGRDRTTTISISTSNDLFDCYATFGEMIFPVRTFDYAVFASSPRAVLILRRRLEQRIVADGTRTLVNLMSHVWTPIMLPIVRHLGIRHTVIVHDASPHLGDPTAWLNPWLLREAMRADQVVTLSEHVARELSDRQGIPREKISVLFHPDLTYGDLIVAEEEGSGNKPLRVLFFGRILPYKGLDTFLDALAILGRNGVPVKASVAGPGDLRAQTKRLSELGVEVLNRWVPADEIPEIFSRSDLVVLTHTNAGQSGVIATAHGMGLPVVAPSVGGLASQIDSEVTGILAENGTPEAIAAAIRRVVEDRGLLHRLHQGVIANKRHRSMAKFLDLLTDVATRDLAPG